MTPGQRVGIAILSVARIGSHLMGAAAIALVAFVAGCTAPPRFEAMEYDGGLVLGDLQRGPARFTLVSVDRMDSPMAKATTIRLFDGVPVKLSQATPEFLLKRGRVFVPRGSAGAGVPGATGADEAASGGRDEPAFTELQGLSSFDPQRVYFVIVGPMPNGPFYRFDVQNGQAVRFGSEWPGGLLDDGTTLRPGAIFIDSRGADHEMPLTRDDVEAVWGAPVRTLKVRPPGA